MKAVVAAALGLALVAQVTQASSAFDSEGRFATLFEPSGVAQLPDGTLVVVEDEAPQALRRVDVDTDGAELRVLEETVLTPGGGVLARFAIGPLDDLEGAASDGSGHVYAIGSHGPGGRAADRRKLVRFSVRGDEAADVVLTRDLRSDLARAYPALAAAFERRGARHALNIEGLAHDRRRGVLLIGLRAPLLDDRAVIVRLLNPDAYLADGAEPAFDAEPWTVDLDEGGVRAMGYDERSDRVLMVSRREARGGGRFELWHAPADGSAEPVRVRLRGDKKAFDDVEGVAVLDRGPDAHRGVLFVRDDGRRDKGRGAEWFVVPRARLDLDMAE